MCTLAVMLNLALCLHSWPPPILLTAARRLQLTTKVCLALFSIVSISVSCQRAFSDILKESEKNVFVLTSLLNLICIILKKTKCDFGRFNQLPSTFIYKSALISNHQSKQQIKKKTHCTHTYMNRHLCSKSDCRPSNSA